MIDTVLPTVELPEPQVMSKGALIMHIAQTDQAQGDGPAGMYATPYCLLGAYADQRGLMKRDDYLSQSYFAIGEDLGARMDVLVDLYQAHDYYRRHGFDRDWYLKRVRQVLERAKLL